MTSASLELPPATRTERLSWAGFDFANSSFTTVIITVVYAKVFTGKIVGTGGYMGWHGDSWWAMIQAVSQGLVIVSAPLIGALADRLAAKKRFLAYATLTCVLTTALLSYPTEGQVLLACFLLLLANFAFSTGENLVAGFLPELAPPEEMGRLSALGWTIGYFGGLAALVLSLVLVEANLVRYVPLAIALFFGISALPTFLFLRERAKKRTSSLSIVRQGFSELITTWSERRQWRDLFAFLLSILFFQGGIAVVIAFSAIFAEQELGMSDGQVIHLFIGLQFSAALGAWTFGHIQDRLGSRPALFGSLFLWLCAVLLAFASHSVPPFVASGLLAGFAMGSSQSASRALVGLFCPAGREGEWFGLWGLATKAATVLGLLFYSILIQTSGNRRMAILATGLLFLVGMALLLRVNVPRGLRAARPSNADRNDHST
ncbi:MAG TPA: MFS transporter [Planctomycetota bacterium]|mgnify:CR=1 FL=1|nr:MFS transporter [Planctomycetota bacterium]